MNLSNAKYKQYTSVQGNKHYETISTELFNHYIQISYQKMSRQLYSARN